MYAIRSYYVDFESATNLVTAARRVLEGLPKKARSGLSEFLHIHETLRSMIFLV